MDQLTIDAYNLQAHEYDEQTLDFWDRFPRTFLNKFAGLVNGKVLDIGCGPGRDGLLLQEAGLDIIGLDASKSMVKICQTKGLDAVIGDFATLPFPDKSFAGAWAYTSLLHTAKKDFASTLIEISRVMKDSGLLGIGLIEGEGEGYKQNEKVTMPRWFSYYSRSEIEGSLSDNGFAVIHFETFKPNTRNYLNFIAKKLN